MNSCIDEYVRAAENKKQNITELMMPRPVDGYVDFIQW